MPFKGEKPNIALIMGILPGTDGVVRTSKFLGNHIPLNTTPADMYGKVMSVPDKAMSDCFRLVTRWTPDEIEQVEQGLAAGKHHPRDIKMKLAHEIVEIFFGPGKAQQAEQAFVSVFQKGNVPAEIPEHTLEPGQSVLDVLMSGGLVKRYSEGRWMLKQNAVRLDGERLNDPNSSFPGPGILKVGKRRFLRVVDES